LANTDQSHRIFKDLKLRVMNGQTNLVCP